VRKDSSEFLTRSDVERVVGQLLRLGVKTVNLGGNEPVFTHGPSIRETILPYIIRTLHDAGLPVGLTTNGMSFLWLDRHHPDELAMINDIDFSLDSPFADEHNANRRARLYDLVVGCIRRCRELGIDCSVIACGMRGNFDAEHLSAFLELTRLLDCEFRINTLKPIEGGLIPEMPSRDQFFSAFEFLMNNTHCITLGESCLTAFTQAGAEGCPCGVSSFRINAKTKDGRIPINPCVYAHEYKAGDLLTDDIFDIIESPAFKAFGDRRRQIPQACRETGCEFLESCCGGCTARTYLVEGTLNAPDPYCPQAYLDTHGGRPDLPTNPPIGCHDGIRVHDNYLCTWIGKVNPEFRDPHDHSLDDFRRGRRDQSPIPLSGHVQVEGVEESLIRVAQGTTPGGSA
jgi:radical SAM protein with 4Fe4S-binding SPASM domain